MGVARESQRDVGAVDWLGLVDGELQARLDRGRRGDVELDIAGEARGDGRRHLQRQLGPAGKVRQRLLDERRGTGDRSGEGAIDEAADEQRDNAERRLRIGDVGGGGGAEERRQLVGFVRRGRIGLRVAAQHQQNLADRQRARIPGRRLECPQTLDLLEHRVDDREGGRKSAATCGRDCLLHVAKRHERLADNRRGNGQRLLGAVVFFEIDEVRVRRWSAGVLQAERFPQQRGHGGLISRAESPLAVSARLIGGLVPGQRLLEDSVGFGHRKCPLRDAAHRRVLVTGLSQSGYACGAVVSRDPLVFATGCNVCACQI